MPHRVTSQEVCEVIETSVTVDPFITTASLMIDKHLQGKGLSSDELKHIELYLSAHLVTLNDPRAQSEGSADQRVTFQGKTGLGLDASHYGQTVKMLDSTGALARLEQRQAVIQVI